MGSIIGDMNKRPVQLIVLVLVAVAAVFLYTFFNSRQANAPSEQNSGITSQPDEQIINEQQGDISVEPNINTEEFKLTGSNVNCSTSTVNGATSRSCSGNIRVIPLARPGMEPGLYKLNEQTKLLHDGTEQDLNSLQQLSQNQTTVRLKLADGSSDMLAEIRY